MAIGAKAGAATARVAGATGRAAVGAAKVGFSLPSHAIEKEEIDLSPEVLALEAPSGPGKHGVWKEGMLRKRPPVKMSNKFVPGRSLQPRQCVLKSDGLYYYSEGGKGLEEARGKIPLIAMRAILLSRTPDGPQIEISVGTRVFAFVGADDACAYSWRLAIDAAKGYKGAAASKRMRERATSRCAETIECISPAELRAREPNACQRLVTYLSRVAGHSEATLQRRWCFPQSLTATVHTGSHLTQWAMGR